MVLFTITRYFVGPKSAFATTSDIALFVAINVIVWTLSGWWFGVSMWSRMNQKYPS